MTIFIVLINNLIPTFVNINDAISINRQYFYYSYNGMVLF